MFQIEINKELEKFLTFLGKRIRIFMKKSSIIVVAHNSCLFRIVSNYQLLKLIDSIWQ